MMRGDLVIMVSSKTSTIMVRSKLKTTIIYGAITALRINSKKLNYLFNIPREGLSRKLT